MDEKCNENPRGQVNHVFGRLILIVGQEVTCQCQHVTVRGERGRWLQITTDVFAGND